MVSQTESLAGMASEQPRVEGSRPEALGVLREAISREWHPTPSRAGLFALMLAVLLFACGLAARLYTLGRPLDAETLAATVAGVAALMLAATAALLAYGRRSLLYRLDDQELTIRWLWHREAIPLGRVDSVYQGTRLGDRVRVVGIDWPGYHIGTAEAEGVGTVQFYGSARDLSSTLIVATPEAAYAVTPADLESFRTELIRRLEAMPEELVAQAAAPRTRSLPLLRISALELRTAALWIASVAAGAAALWGVLQLPADVPDTGSPPAGNSTGEANDWAAVGQSFVARWNNLNAVSVVLGADRQTDAAEVTFHVKLSPNGRILRTVTQKISTLPQGNPMQYRPGSLTEQWVTFQFPPIPDSAGRQLYFSVEGKEVPRENTVRVLMFYHNRYPSGEAYLNEKAVDAHVVFRAHSRGRIANWVTVLSENLTAGRPGPLGNPATYLVLGLLYVGLIAALLRAAARAVGAKVGTGKGA